MLVKRIANATRVLGQSQGYLGLPVRDGVIFDTATRTSAPCMLTAWEPTPAELAALNAGGTIYLRILGTAHPPVMMWAEEPE